LSFTLNATFLEYSGTDLKLSAISGWLSPSSRTIVGIGVYATDAETDTEEKEPDRGRRKKYVNGVMNGSI
jgi:hypothetical protein